MGDEFDSFIRQFTELVGEFQSLSLSEARLRESLRTEATRAEAAEAARDAANCAAAEARSNAAASSAAATQAAAALAKTHDEYVSVKMQLDITERNCKLLSDKSNETSRQITTLERELQSLRPLQSTQSNMQRQYLELQERIKTACEDSKSEAARLECELRRVERCASAGNEIRERARLAAAAHAREKRLTAAEFQQTQRELLNANAEIARLSVQLTEYQCRLADYINNTSTKPKDVDLFENETLAEMKAALEAERSGSARLERALAAALADNAKLAAELHSKDNAVDCDRAAHDASIPAPPSPTPTISTNSSCPIDSFLAR